VVSNPSLDDAEDASESLGHVNRGFGLGQGDSVFLAQVMTEGKLHFFAENGTSTGKVEKSFFGNEMEQRNFHFLVDDEKKNVHGILG
jgi:hypothetical protein